MYADLRLEPSTSTIVGESAAHALAPTDNIRVRDDRTITCTTGDMQLTAPRPGQSWGVPKAGSPVFTTMRILSDKVEMDLHGVEKWAWLKSWDSS